MSLFRFAVLALTLLIAACASPEAPSRPDTTAVPIVPPDTSNAEANAAGPDAWTAGITDVQHEAAVPGRLVAVRTAAHEGFDRIVFAFDGEDVPGYHLEYVDAPVRACGSGEPVPLAGDGWLEMRLYPTAAHTEAGESTITERERTPGLPVLRELKLTCDFEAVVTWVAGLASPNPYRVFDLQNPARLVVDVQH